MCKGSLTVQQRCVGLFSNFRGDFALNSALWRLRFWDMIGVPFLQTLPMPIFT